MESLKPVTRALVGTEGFTACWQRYVDHMSEHMKPGFCYLYRLRARQHLISTYRSVGSNLGAKFPLLRSQGDL